MLQQRIRAIQDFILQEIGQQKNSLFWWSPFFLSIGISAYFGLRAEPHAFMGAILALIALAFFVMTYQRRDFTARHKVRNLVAFILFLIALGFTAAQWRTHLVGTPMLTKAVGPVDIIGTIERVEPQEAGQGSRIILNHLEIERLDPEKTPRKIRLKVRKDEGLLSGQRVKLLAKLNPPSSPVAPGAFDFQRYAFYQGLGAVGFAYNQPEILEPASGLSHFWAKTRERLSSRVERYLNSREGAIANALMTGQRGSIAKEDIEAMRDAGLAHLLAISGMHVGMIVGVLFFFSRLIMALIPHFALHHPVKKYAAVFALLGAVLYTLIVGATIPTQRALMMSGLVLIAIVLDRTAISMRLVALAAFVVLMISPDSLVSVSFQMSFAAVVALVCFYERLRPIWTALYSKAGFMRRAILYLLGVVLTTLVAGFATGFYSLYHFQTFAFYGTIANIIAVPLMAFIVMPALLLSYFVMPIGLEGFSLDIAGYGISWILASAHWTANMEGAVTRAAVFPFWAFVIITICLWFMCVWKGKLNYVAFGLALIVTLTLPFYHNPDIQISPDFKLVSMRDEKGDLWISSARQDRYTAENWYRRNGQEQREKQIFPKNGEKSDELGLQCDVYGCLGKIDSVKIAYATSQRSVVEDCKWADLILSTEPIKDRDCDAKYIIDRFNVWRNGSHAIWVKGDKVNIKTDQQMRGIRPWNESDR